MVLCNKAFFITSFTVNKFYIIGSLHRIFSTSIDYRYLADSSNLNISDLPQSKVSFPDLFNAFIRFHFPVRVFCDLLEKHVIHSVVNTRVGALYVQVNAYPGCNIDTRTH